MLKQGKENPFNRITPLKKRFQWHRCYYSGTKPTALLFNNQHACEVASCVLIKTVLFLYVTNVWHTCVAQKCQIVSDSSSIWGRCPQSLSGIRSDCKVPSGWKTVSHNNSSIPYVTVYNVRKGIGENWSLFYRNLIHYHQKKRKKNPP